MSCRELLLCLKHICATNYTHHFIRKYHLINFGTVIQNHYVIYSVISLLSYLKSSPAVKLPPSTSSNSWRFWSSGSSRQGWMLFGWYYFYILISLVTFSRTLPRETDGISPNTLKVLPNFLYHTVLTLYVEVLWSTNYEALHNVFLFRDLKNNKTTTFIINYTDIIGSKMWFWIKLCIDAMFYDDCGVLCPQ